MRSSAVKWQGICLRPKKQLFRYEIDKGEISRELEPFYKVTGLKEIGEQLNRAESLFVKYTNSVMETYHLNAVDDIG